MFSHCMLAAADPRFVIQVHGGAWAIPESLRQPHIDGVRRAHGAALDALKSGVRPLEAVLAALKVMEREKIEGAMVNIISVNAHGGTSFLTPYSASKGALVTLTKNFAHSVANRRIKVNGLNIGWVDTPGEHVTLQRFHGAPDNWLAAAEASRPWGRLMKPDEVARAVAFLVSDESGLMTGSIIDFDQVVQGPNEQIGPAPRS